MVRVLRAGKGDSVNVNPGLSNAYGFELPASTLPTRFPAALGIGHGLPAA